MKRPFDGAALLHFIRDSLFRTDSPLHHEFSISLERFIAERIASRESEWFPCTFCDFTACRRSLQILKPRSSNQNSASMRCRQQQQVLLRQLITESTLCSPPRRMQLKLL